MSEELPREPIHLRPPARPRLARALVSLLLPAIALVFAGAPVWFFMHGDAAGWADEVRVTARVEPGATCREGPPPGNPLTCDATWESASGELIEGEVSDRYGGTAVPADGGAVAARTVAEDRALTGFHSVFLCWALISPYLTAAGVGLALIAALGLTRFDPRWQRPRTDLDLSG